MARRPEHVAPAEVFYGVDEANKYTRNTRMIEIQSEMSERCIELLALNPDEGSKFILDIGCGSGLSGNVLDHYGHAWVGLDIAPAMLSLARDRVDSDLFLSDMGDGMFFRPGVFDGAISVSAIQWLCNAEKSWHEPYYRLKKFFVSLYRCMARGSRALFQFYPENGAQMEMITSAATRAGFSGGLVVDFPESTKAKKYFLCLMAGQPPGGFQPPVGKGTEEEEEQTASRAAVQFYSEKVKNKHKKDKRMKHKSGYKTKDWILQKKEYQRSLNKNVRPDSKYTGRKRSSKKFF